MPESTQFESILAIEIGASNTRALLFDVVESNYRLLASGVSLTTLEAPYGDVSEGVRDAIRKIHEITGRVFFNVDETLVVPTAPDGIGVDAVVVTLSAGTPMRVIAMGLLEDISLESAKQLASSVSSQIIDTFSMNDRRSLESRLDDFQRLRPDLVVIAGGTDNGASKSVLRLLESVGLACYLLPRESRPQILYAGNQAVAEEVGEIMREFAPTRIAPNVRPTLEQETLAPAQAVLRDIYRIYQTKQQHGLKELDEWSNGRLMPASQGFGRIVRFISQYSDSGKGVLGVDVGSANTTIAAAYQGELQVSAYPQLGLGVSLPRLLNYIKPGQVAQWLPTDMSVSDVRDFMYQKSIHPNSIPFTVEELYLEQAYAREILRTAVNLTRKRFPPNIPQTSILPAFEPIIVGGAVFTNAPKVGQALLAILDALEPGGITTIILDKHNMLASLGAAAEINPEMTVQVLDSRAMVNLGTVIAPVSRARYGTPVLSIRIKQESGEDQRMEIKQGSLEIISLPHGQMIQVHIRPLHRANVGMGGAGQGGSLKVPAGVFGLIIDARGRPLVLPTDQERRKDFIKKWLGTLGG